MRRFFIEEDNITGNRVIIKGEEARHIAQVLRIKEKDKIKVFTGKGREYLIKITKASKREVIGDILKETELKTEPMVPITLVQGLPKKDKMDFIVQKATELGVKKVIPIITQRTIVKLDRERAKARQVRWQRIALEAAKQSGRVIIPKVDQVTTFIQSLDIMNKENLNLIPWEEEETTSLKEVLKPFTVHRSFTPLEGETSLTGPVTIFIGPEGGFTPDEVKQAKERGAIPVSLGPRLLRTETAGLVTLALILYELGDLG